MVTPIQIGIGIHDKRICSFIYRFIGLEQGKSLYFYFLFSFYYYLYLHVRYTQLLTRPVSTVLMLMFHWLIIIIMSCAIYEADRMNEREREWTISNSVTFFVETTIFDQQCSPCSICGIDVHNMHNSLLIVRIIYQQYNIVSKCKYLIWNQIRLS